jgi:hypothetical protein
MIGPEWVSAIAESVTAIGVILAFWQLKDAREVNRENHEKARREGAVQYCLVWTNSLSQYSSNAGKLVDLLDTHECSAIAERRAVTIAERHAVLLAASFPANVDFERKDGTIHLTGQQSAELRWTIVRYLNTLEVICGAWHAATVDRKIIEDEFRYLFSLRDGRRLLRNFREAMGNEFFPAIDAFEDALEEAEKPPKPRSLIA